MAVNGVVFDPNTDEFWKNDRRSDWMIEALSGARPLGIDQSNAHVQPNGAYHYHGVPTGLIQALGGRTPVLIGWAADGFPIYADERLRSSWPLKAQRDGGPGGRPDGTYVLDWEFAAGTGDLDQCNGRQGPTAEFPQGTYYFVVTANFPTCRAASWAPPTRVSSSRVARTAKVNPTVGGRRRRAAKPCRCERIALLPRVF